MKIFIDLFPIVVFCITYVLSDIYIATAATMVACIPIAIYQYLKHKKVEIAIMILFVMGGATIIFHNPIFIQWKPTIVYWGLAISFFWMRRFYQTSLLQKLADDKFQLTENLWQDIDSKSIIFFTLLGIANLLVVYTCTTHIWVMYKLFGSLSFTLVYVIYIANIISKQVGDDLISS
jgi:intracellular septation protein